MTALIVLGTQSAIKVDCVRRFFGEQVKLKCVNTTTDFVQPLGEEQGVSILELCLLSLTVGFKRYVAKHCLTQRIEQCESNSFMDTVLLIAIENFIYKDGASFYDACMVGFRRRVSMQKQFSSIQFTSTNAERRVLVPSFINTKLDEALTTNVPLKVTGGEMLREFYANDERYSDKDWFLACGSTFDRRTQITNVLTDNAEKLKL